MYDFIKNQIQKLAKDSMLKPKYFTFVDDSNSLDKANEKLESLFLELSDPRKFLLKYPRMRDIERYKDTKNLKSYLAKYTKIMLDCYAASYFTHVGK
ncbi:hypothetical protein Dsin_012090 [Dipteronia sinensis]|uniref:Uncharacterized protein n=1 Tax=Dipteronia sinensis TaxID=43782 RepID=A0AAE0AI13_9ROSI|nr:hypothetical protein Dsin_012090 [Dipteronia sinensis]